MAEDERQFLQGLEVEVEAELNMAWSSDVSQPVPPPSEWLIDPTDVEREEVGLSNLYGAVEVLKGVEVTDPEKNGPNGRDGTASPS